jgi:hypothetical protein
MQGIRHFSEPAASLSQPHLRDVILSKAKDLRLPLQQQNRREYAAAGLIARRAGGKRDER